MEDVRFVIDLMRVPEVKQSLVMRARELAIIYHDAILKYEQKHVFEKLEIKIFNFSSPEDMEQYYDDDGDGEETIN